MFSKKGACFLFSLIILFAVGCKNMSNEILDGADTDPGPDDSISVSPGDIPPDDTQLIGAVFILEDVPNAADEWADNAIEFNAAYHFNSATIEGDTLTVSVAYGGGCETHEFALLAEPAFMESFPVQLGISIVHNANLDFCERWVEEAYHFDLTPIKKKYQAAYKQDAGTVVLRPAFSLDIVTVPQDVLEKLPAGLVYEFTE